MALRSMWQPEERRFTGHLAESYHANPWHRTTTLWTLELSRTQPRRTMREVLNEMTELGEEILRGLPTDFVSENTGRFAALGLSSKRVLTVRDGMIALADALAANPPGEPYYIAHIGFDFIGRLE